MILSPIRMSVLSRIDAHMAKTGLAEGVLGKLALGDHKAIKRLRAGENITLCRVEGLLEFIEGHRASEADKGA